MRKFFKSLLALSAILLGLTGAASAQTPTYLYYVPLPEQQIHNAFQVLYASTGSTYHTVISIVPSESNIKIYFDEWEDGYETTLGVPLQSTTKIWGDNNPANGIPPGYATDILRAGRPIVLENDIALPRLAAVIKYDGRDKFGSTQSLAVSRSSWALSPGTVLADATEFYNTKTFGTFFYSPIGTLALADNSFGLVSMCVQASQNATQILIDKEGNGSVDVTAVINEGESYQVNGGILTSATVTSSKPVQVTLITGRVGGSYASRWFNLLPFYMWDRAYYTPVGTPKADALSSVFIFNPHATSLSVNCYTSPTPTILNIPAKTVQRFNMPIGASAHFHASQPFYAVGGTDMDAGNLTWDWGYSLIPELFLTNSIYVGWGPGSGGSPITSNGNPVWVSSTEDTDPLTVYVDLDGDPATGPLTDITGNKYDFSRVIAPYTYTTIYDVSDKNQTGMHVYTIDGRNIAAAWGEDALTAGPGNPFLDVGTTIPPDPAFVVKKAYRFTYDPGNNRLADAGDTIQFILKINNYTLQPYTDIYVYDTLPSEVTYKSNSTYYDLIPLADETSPNTIFPLDQNGYYISLLPSGAKDSIIYKCVVNAPVNYANFVNRVTARDNFGSVYKSNVTIPAFFATTSCTINFTNSLGANVTSYNENATLYIKVTDNDNNQNILAIDSVKVTVTSTSTDSELLYLQETGVNTGIFTRSLPSSKTSGAGANNGTLYASAGQTIGVTYTDLIFGGTACTLSNVPITGPSFRKALYLSDSLSATGLDRIKPFDGTAALSSVLGGSTGSASVAVYARDNGVNDGKYASFSAGTFAADATFLQQNNPEFIFSAKCPTRNEVLVAAQTNASGLFLRKWDGTNWTDPPSPLSTPVVAAAGVTNTYRGSCIAYEQLSGDAIFVWSDASQTAGNRLRFSVWNGSSWTSPAAITATGNNSTPMFMQIASKPGADEIILTVAFNDANRARYAVIWNGSTWGNNQSLGGTSTIEYTTIACAYTANGTGFAIYEASASGARADFFTWNGSAWSATDNFGPAGSPGGYNRWVIVASNPTTNILVAGFITTSTSGVNMWFATWNGATTTWTTTQTATLGANNDRKAIGIASETTSGRFMAIYSANNNDGTKYKIFTPNATTGSWGGEISGPTTGGAVPTVQQLYSKPGSNNIMWMASNANNDLFASEWNGTSFATSTTLSTELLTPSKEPFSFWYGSSVTGATTLTYTQNPAMCSGITLATGGQIRAKLHLKNHSNVTAANINAVIKNAGTTFATLTGSSFTDNTGTKNDTLILTANSPAQTINAASAVSMDVNIISGTPTFQIGYDSVTLNSMLSLPVTNVIDITSFGVYTAANPGGSLITNAYNGTTLYVRALVSDPFGYSDIHDVVLRITDPANGTTDVQMTPITPFSGCTKTFEYVWPTGVTQGAYSLRAITSEGYENEVKDTAQTSFTLQFLDTGTPCSIDFTNASYSPVSSYANAAGTIYFNVQDLDQNLNPLSADNINITVSSSNGDIATVSLTESGNNTGIFRGSIAYVVTGVVTQNDATLTTVAGATLNLNYTDPDTPTDVCTDNAFVAAGVAALSASKSRLLPTDLYAVVNDTVRWIITVTNPGTTNLTDIALTDTYNSTCLTYINASVTPSSQSAGTITWNTAALGGTLNSGQSVNVTVTFKAASGCGSTTNTATATATGVSNAVATSPVTLDSPTLTIVKTRTSPLNVPVYIGTNVEFQIVVTNTGNTTISTVPLVDTYSDYNFSFVSANPTESSSGAGQVNWSNVGPIAPLGTATIDVVFTALHGNEGLMAINNASVDYAVDEHGNPVPSVNDSAGLLLLSPPVAIDDFDTTLINVAVTGNVLVNDYDNDGDVVTVTAADGSAGGTAGGIGGTFTITPSGQYTYTPPTSPPSSPGNATFTYKICDPSGACDTAVVTITVLACYAPPARPENVH